MSDHAPALAYAREMYLLRASARVEFGRDDPFTEHLGRAGIDALCEAARLMYEDRDWLDPWAREQRAVTP